MLTIDSAISVLILGCNNCGRRRTGTPRETCLIDEDLTKEDSNAQNAVLIENSPFDPAARWVKRECKACKLPTMALVILEDGARIYICKCGMSEK